MFSRWLRNKPEPLRGAPAVRRQKAYSAQSGYVYQYYYQGQRPSSPEPGTEYVFDVSSDRRTSRPVSVFVTRIRAAGTAAPVWSVTVPRKLPLVV